METSRSAGHQVGIIDLIAVGLIVVYRKLLSPLKGFSCAHRYQHGGLSCSQYVQQVALRRGLWSGYADIRRRFQACRLAARQIHANPPGKQTGALDCGFDSCGDFGVVDSCFGDSGAEDGGKRTTIMVLPIGLLLILVLVFTVSDWFKAPLVSAIDIRLIENRQEAEETGVARLLGGKNPDYQVVFVVNGKKVATNTLANSSAKTWIRLKPKSAFELGELEQIRILNKQVLEDIVLDTIVDPPAQGRGALYEYRLTED